MSLTLASLSKFYGNKPVLKQINCAFNTGTISLLLGSNGAGKSTLLRLIAGLAQASAGKINLPEHWQIAYLAHSTFLYPGLTALENLAFWSKVYALNCPKAELLGYLKQVGLGEHAYERAGIFSRGMAQRLNLARVLMQKAELLLLDEPDTGLDIDARQMLYKAVLTAREQGTCTIIVSHNQNETLPIADRVLFLQNTKLQFDGKVNDYLREYHSTNLEANLEINLNLDKQEHKQARATKIENLTEQKEAISKDIENESNSKQEVKILAKSEDLADSKIDQARINQAKVDQAKIDQAKDQVKKDSERGGANLFSFALAILRKDLVLTLGRSSGLVQGMLLGLLLIFLFSLAQEPGMKLTAQNAAAVFWISSTFCQILIFNSLYALEERCQARVGLILANAPVQGIWLGKLLAGLILLFCAQLLFVPANLVFLGQELNDQWQNGQNALLALFLVDIGMCILGSLLGALAQGEAIRESLLGILIFPLLIPLLLAGIATATQALAPITADSSWVGLAAAFDAVFAAAGLILFPFLYTGENL